MVRGTIKIMNAHASLMNQYPTRQDLLEMSKSLVIKYPCLNDKTSKHITLFNKLRKRFYNEKPIQNKRIKSLIKTTLKNGGETDVGFSSSQSVSELGSSPPVKSKFMLHS
nr:uncharacterized protein LOC124813911 [Hydra vulgaris]